MSRGDTVYVSFVAQFLILVRPLRGKGTLHGHRRTIKQSMLNRSHNHQMLFTDHLIGLKVTVTLWPIQQKPPTYTYICQLIVMPHVVHVGRKKNRCLTGDEALSHLWNGKLAHAGVQHMEMYQRLSARSTAFTVCGVVSRWGYDSKQHRTSWLLLWPHRDSFTLLKVSWHHLSEMQSRNSVFFL